MKPQILLFIRLALCTLLTGCGRNGTRTSETAESYQAVSLVRILGRDSAAVDMGQARLHNEAFRTFARETVLQSPERFVSTTFSVQFIWDETAFYPELVQMIAIDPNPQTAKEAANLLVQAAKDYFHAQNQIDLEKSVEWLYTFLETKQNDPDTPPQVLESLKQTIEKERIRHQENFIYIKLIEAATLPEDPE